MLARYADEGGHDVYLVVVTSGQQGASNTDIPAGDQLGRARESEVRCSARKLGIHEPYLLGFQHGDISTRVAQEPMVERLAEIINEVKPDVVITSPSRNDRKSSTRKEVANHLDLESLDLIESGPGRR